MYSYIVRGEFKIKFKFRGSYSFRVPRLNNDSFKYDYFLFLYVVEGGYYGSEPHEPALELLQLLRYIDYWQSGIATPSNHTSNTYVY